VDLANPVIRQCTIENCRASADGGGIFVNNGSPIIKQCNVQNCTAGNRGGGICLLGSGAIVQTSHVVGNTAKQGGGIFCFALNPQFLNSQIAVNGAVDIFVAGDGGGIMVDSSVATVRNCTITGNAAGGQNPGRGGGVFITGVTLSSS